jgi:hypothetical protein
MSDHSRKLIWQELFRDGNGVYGNIRIEGVDGNEGLVAAHVAQGWGQRLVQCHNDALTRPHK